MLTIHFITSENDSFFQFFIFIFFWTNLDTALALAASDTFPISKKLGIKLRQQIQNAYIVQLPRQGVLKCNEIKFQKKIVSITFLCSFPTFYLNNKIYSIQPPLKIHKLPIPRPMISKFDNSYKLITHHLMDMNNFSINVWNDNFCTQ